ncbi:MAG: SMP-30/gluconolactonase/LRE family protein [Steroidobacteraceae bacterium]
MKHTISVSLLSSVLLTSAMAEPTSVAKTLSDSQVKVVGTGIVAPEGPTVLPDGSVAMVEFSPGNIVSVHPDGTREVITHPGSGVVGTVLGKDGALYVAKLDTSAFMRRANANPPAADGMNAAPAAEGMAGAPPASSGMSAMDGTPSAILRIDLNTKQVSKLYTELDGRPIGSPNDLAVDEWGDLWITEQITPGIVYAHADGSQIKLVVSGVKGINGIALSPNKRTLYVMNDSKLTAYEITGRGTLKSEQGKPVAKVLVDWPKTLHEPDGIKTEANGNILLASWEDGIVRYSPSGKLLSQIIVPNLQVINIAFSPRDKNALYLAAHPVNNMSGMLVKIPWDAAGAF